MPKVFLKSICIIGFDSKLQSAVANIKENAYTDFLLLTSEFFISIRHMVSMIEVAISDTASISPIPLLYIKSKIISLLLP